MPPPAKNTVPAKTEAIKKKIADGKGQPQKEWRVAGHEGLVLIVRPSGVGGFYFFYRPQLGDRQRKLPLGDFPTTTLAKAIETAAEQRIEVAKGKDPAADKASLRASVTFQELADRFVAESQTLSETTRSAYRYSLAADVYPSFGTKPAIAITPADIAAVCSKIKMRGAIVQAQRTKTTIGGVYSWAKRQSLLSADFINPARLVPHQQEVKSVRKRSPTDDEIKALWRAIDKPSRLSLSVRIIIKLGILIGQRRSDVCGARVDELHDLGGASPTWTIAADVVKAGRVVVEGRKKSGAEQSIYLSRQAAALLEAAVKTCSAGGYLFPSDTNRTKNGKTRKPHIHGDSVTQAMTRLCADAAVDDLTFHDMRRAIGNFLKNNGIGREVRDLILHHKDASVDGQHYSSSATMEAQCRSAWQLWADHVASLTTIDAEKVAEDQRVTQDRSGSLEAGNPSVT